MLLKHVVVTAVVSLALLFACKITSSEVASDSAGADSPSAVPKAYGIFAATVKPQFGKTLEYGIYLLGASQTLPPYDGHAVAWGKDHLSFEGNYPSGYVMILEFSSMTAFHAWYASPAYQAVKGIRLDATEVVMSILQEGVPSTASQSTVLPTGAAANKAFVILNNKITDETGYASYLGKAAPILQKYGGRTVTQSRTHELLEGSVNPDNIEVYEFATLDALQTWYHSPEYQAIIPDRQRTSDIVFLLGQQGIPQL